MIDLVAAGVPVSEQESDYAIAQDKEETPRGLRWRNGVLQQEWVSRVYMASGMVHRCSRWEDVPIVESKEP